MGAKSTVEIPAREKLKAALGEIVDGRVVDLEIAIVGLLFEGGGEIMLGQEELHQLRDIAKTPHSAHFINTALQRLMDSGFVEEVERKKGAFRLTQKGIDELGEPKGESWRGRKAAASLLKPRNYGRNYDNL